MENSNNSIKEVIQPLIYDVVISKDNNDISLSLTRYDIDSINLFTLIQLGCKVTINVSLVDTMVHTYLHDSLSE